jgi:rhodanese-related sulfurtransferase
LPILLKRIQQKEQFVFLDTRETKEFKVSHLPGAINVGYDDFELEKVLSQISKSKNVIVYCSVGFRSDKINRILIKAGYNSKNLIGGIFEWVNQDQSVFKERVLTKKVHTYNKSWSKWLDKGEKVY